MNVKKMILNGALFTSLMVNQVEALSVGKFFRFFLPGRFTFGVGAGVFANKFVNSEYYKAKSSDVLTKALIKAFIKEGVSVMELSDAEKEKMIDEMMQDTYFGLDKGSMVDFLNKLNAMVSNEIILSLTAFGYSEIIKLPRLYKDMQRWIGSKLASDK